MTFALSLLHPHCKTGPVNTETNRIPHPGKISWAALAILFLVWGVHCAVNLVIFKEAEVPPYYDAANHTNIAMEIRDHYNGFEPNLKWFDELYSISSYYPPCYHFLAAICLKFRPHTLDSARLPNLFFLGLLMISVYLWGTRLFDSGTGLLAGVLVSLFPVVHGLTREIYVDLAVLSWAAAGAFLVWESDRFHRKGIAFLFGIVCGFGLLTKWTFPVFIGLPVLWVFSEMFLPISVGKFIGKVFRGNDEETVGLFRAGVFTIAWVGLLFSVSSILGGTGSMLVATGMSLAFLVLLIGTTREALRSPGLGESWRESKRPLPPIGNCLFGIAIASIPALLIAGPWYLKHFGFIASEGSRVLTEAAKVRGMAEVQTLESMVYYFLTLESHRPPTCLLGFDNPVPRVVVHSERKNPFALATRGNICLILLGHVVPLGQRPALLHSGHLSLADPDFLVAVGKKLFGSKVLGDRDTCGGSGRLCESSGRDTRIVKENRVPDPIRTTPCIHRSGPLWRHAESRWRLAPPSDSRGDSDPSRSCQPYRRAYRGAGAGG